MTQLFVGNLKYEVTADDLEQQISKVVKVNAVDLKSDEQGKNIGFGYVDVDAEEEDIDELISQLDNVQLQQRPMKVKRKGDFSRKKRPTRQVFFPHLARRTPQWCENIHWQLGMVHYKRES